MRSDGWLRRPWSLALRITLAVSVTMAVVFSACAWLVSRSIERHFEELDLGELQAVAESLGHALGAMPDRDDEVALQRRLAQAVAGHHGVFFAVVAQDGRTIFAKAPSALLGVVRAAPGDASLGAGSVRNWSDGSSRYRGSVLQMASERVLVAVSIDAHEHYLVELRSGLWWGALAATALAVATVCVAVRWGHAPLRRIGATVRGITAERLDVRLDPVAVPAELTPLVSAFNTMLDQIQASFERLSHFSADIAHELRTPVTNLMTQAQVALSKDRPASAYREVLYAGLDQLDRLRRMIGDMLFLAQAEDPQRRLTREPVDLAELAGSVFEFYEAWADESGVRLRFDANGGGQALEAVDRGMLQRALTNLVGNALRHTARGGAVTVRAAQERSAIRIDVENPGAPIAAEHLKHLFDRFYRVDPARQRESEGAGLGLAIVRAIAEAHGGSVGVDSGAGINVFWMRLPVA